MKKLFALLLVALLAFLTLIPVSAVPVSTDILKGTPAVDGILDDIYTQSASYELDNPGFYIWGDGAMAEDAAATVYFLWDAGYLYMAAVVTDSTIFSAEVGDPWQNDAAEVWFLDEELKFKIHGAADGQFWLGGDGDGATPFIFEDSLHAAKIDGNKYIIEIALPMNNLAAGKTFGFSLQVNDIFSTDASAGGTASGSQTAEHIFTCSANEVVLPEPEPEPEPEVAEPEAPVVVTPAAQTGDVFMFAAAALIGAVVIGRRHNAKKITYI
jgi:hypothetical protein